MKALRGPLGLQKLTLVALLAGAAVFATLPGAFGASSGINSESSTPLPSDFDSAGCTSCHGDHNFAATEDKVSYTILDAEGAELTSGQYEHDATYTITITLRDEINPDAGNHAGFYLSATAGEFVVGEDTNVQVTGGGLEASHTNAGQVSWSVDWHAPESGAVAFQLLVNDVDGSGAPDPADNVYREFFALTDEEGAQLGAAEEEEVHYGLALPQYWLGLIALASMIFVILFSFVYLKFVSPHNTDAKDR